MRLFNCNSALEPHISDIPERQLWAEVLRLAIFDLRGPRTERGSSSAEGATEKQEALDWILANGSDPGGFKWTCEVLGIDPDRARSNLMRRFGAAQVSRLTSKRPATISTEAVPPLRLMI